MGTDKTMITGKSESGFEFSVQESALNDYRLLKIFRQIDKGRADYMVDAIDMLLGDEQSERLESFIQERDGEVATSAVFAEFRNIMSVIRALKN